MPQTGREGVAGAQRPGDQIDRLRELLLERVQPLVALDLHLMYRSIASGTSRIATHRQPSASSSTTARPRRRRRASSRAACRRSIFSPDSRSSARAAPDTCLSCAAAFEERHARSARSGAARWRCRPLVTLNVLQTAATAALSRCLRADDEHPVGAEDDGERRGECRRSR